MNREYKCVFSRQWEEHQTGKQETLIKIHVPLQRSLAIKADFVNCPQNPSLFHPFNARPSVTAFQLDHISQPSCGFAGAI